MTREDRKQFTQFKRATAKYIQEVDKDIIIIKWGPKLSFGISGDYLYGKHLIYFICDEKGDENIYRSKQNFLFDLKHNYNVNLNF